MSDKFYNCAKRFVQIILPAFATFYVALADALEGVITLPYPTQVAQVVAALVVFLSACLGYSDSLYTAKQASEAKENSEANTDGIYE